MTVRNQTVYEDDDSEIIRIPTADGKSAVYEARGPYGKVVCREATLEAAKRRLTAYMDKVRKASG